MFFIFDGDCEILVVIVRPGDSVFLLSDYPGAEFSVFIFSSLLELNLEACWELREYALIDKFLRKSKGFNIFQSHKHKFCHLVEQDVVLTKKVFCQECLGEHILLELHGLVKQLESSSNLTGLDEVHLQDFLAFIVDDVAFFLVREIARHQALHKELNYVSIKRLFAHKEISLVENKVIEFVVYYQGLLEFFWYRVHELRPHDDRQSFVRP
jgi:hypothetical protein